MRSIFMAGRTKGEHEKEEQNLSELHKNYRRHRSHALSYYYCRHIYVECWDDGTDIGFNFQHI